MGFFNVAQRTDPKLAQGYSVNFLNKAECKACPLKGQHGGDMQPVGSDEPIIYMLGEAPGKKEIDHQKPFIGPAGKVLRFRIPEKWDKKLRWNNCVRSRPFDRKKPSVDRPPLPVEIECCRPSVERDIEKTKPRAIFGFGNVPLNWALKQSGVTKWNGRRIPIKIGKHACWFFPMMHPSYVLRSRKFTPSSKKDYGSDTEFVFAKDLERAFAAVEDLPEPVVHDKHTAVEGIDIVTGGKGEKDVNKVLNFLDSLRKEKFVGFDYETNGLKPYAEDKKILTVALAGSRKSLSFPLWHPKSQWTEAQTRVVEKAFKRFLKNYKGRKCVHQLSYEMLWTAHFYGREYLRFGKWGDSLSQGYLLDSRQGALSLDDLCQQYFGLNIKEIFPVNKSNLEKAEVDDVTRYNALDAKYHRLLYLAQKKRLKEEGLLRAYKHQLKRIPTLVLTELKGVPIDQRVVSRYYEKYTERLKRVEEKITQLPEVKKFRSLKGRAFKPGSSTDVQFLLKEVIKAKLPEDLRDIKGDGTFSADEKYLRTVDHRATKLILRFRAASKMLSTYIKPVMPDSPLLYSGSRIHPQITTNRTKTWRTNSEDPNIQNWPKRTQAHIRKQVKPEKNYRVVCFDFSGIQARNVAMESRDKALVDAFKHRYDIHTAWMEELVRLYPKWVSEGAKKLATDKDLKKAYRHKAKNEFVFPSIFGARPKTLAGYLSVPDNVAERLSDKFWGQFPDIKRWHKSLENQYKKYGYVNSLAGFRRYAPISPNQLINAPIQADESIIVMDAMNRLSELEDDDFQANLMVHDDLTFIWHKDKVDELAETVITMMLDVPFKWARIVPIGVEMSIGRDWYKQETVGEFFSDKWSGSLV